MIHAVRETHDLYIYIKLIFLWYKINYFFHFNALDLRFSINIRQKHYMVLLFVIKQIMISLTQLPLVIMIMLNTLRL